MKYILPFLLAGISLYVINYRTHEPVVLKEVKNRYDRLIQYIRDNKDKVDERFWVLEKEVLITGFVKKTINKNSAIGYNINKGYEIGLCIDGDVNEVFHVLIHELAHSVTKSYSHDAEFWENFEKLKTLCHTCGVYTPLKGKSYICGKYIQD